LGAVLPGLWVNEGGQSATGALLDHVLRLYGLEATAASHAAVCARLEEMLAQGEVGLGLHVLPDFNGSRSPFADPLARGVIHGLALDRGYDAACALYWRAAVGLALGMRQIIAHMEMGEGQGAAAAARKIRTLIVAGGHGRSDLLMQLYADVTGCTVELCHEPDAVLAGTAMAAAGTGPFSGAQEAAQAMAARSRRLQPDLARHEAFATDYAIFQRLQAHRAEIAAMGR
jgi:ribulose kinase